MTLFKQMAITISLIITLLLSSVMVINYKESQKYIEDELYKNTVNSLSVLSNKLSQNGGEKAYIQSIIDSEFDSGYYKSIMYSSNDGNWTYGQEYGDLFKGVPNWFMYFVNATPQVLSRDVSSGWNILGKIYMQADPSTLYMALYKIFTDLVYLFIISIILSIIIFSIAIKIILKPLIEMQKQADAIAHNEFIIQKSIPKTVEFRDVVLAMNSMVKKVKFMFDNANRQLAEQKKQDYTDSVTKLKSREYLIDKLPHYLKPDAEKSGGINIIISFSGIIEANKKLGRREVDKLYMDISNIFRDATKEFDDTIIARMNGTEFDIFIPHCSIDNVLDKIQWIQIRSIETIKGYGLDKNDTYLSFGIYEYQHTQTIGELFSMADNTLQKAKSYPSHIYYQEFDNSQEIKGKDKWRELLNKSIEEASFSFITNDVIDTKTNEQLDSVLNIVMNTQDKQYIHEEFMPIAIELGLSAKIYSQAISILSKNKEINFSALINTLRLPSDYLTSKSAYGEIKQLCMKFSSEEKQTLVLEISDKFIVKNPVLVKIYKELLDKHNIAIGIFEFIGESENYMYLQEINPDYIKTDASFLLSQTPQELLALETLTKTLDISLIATGVTDEKTAKKLRSIDIYKMQGSYMSLSH